MPAAVVTRIAFVPVPRGVIAVHVVLDGQDTDFMSIPPILMVVAPARLRPVIVTAVPPERGPWLGLTRVITGLASVPVPVTVTEVVLPAAFQKLSVVLTGPADVGANETVAVQEAPAARSP